MRSLAMSAVVLGCAGCILVLGVDDKQWVPPEQAMSASTVGTGGGGMGGHGGAGGEPDPCPSIDPQGLPPLLADPVASKMVLWLDGEHGLSDGVWCDRSGNGHHAVPVATPPTMVDDVYRAVRFDDATTLSMPGPFNDFEEGTSWVVVQRPIGDHSMYAGRPPLRLGQSFNPDAPPGAQPYDLMSLGCLGTNDDFIFSICDPAIGSCFQAYSSNWFQEDVWKRTVVAAGTSVRAWFDGVEVVINTNVPFPWPPPWDTPRAVGAVAAESYVGDIAEIIVFGKVLDEADVATLEAYWARKRDRL
jgi:hypothetical protein